MKALRDRAEALARAAQKLRVEALVEQWRAVPGARVAAGASEVMIEARGLRRRRLTDAALRFAGVGR